MSDHKIIHEISVEDLMKLATDSDEPVLMDKLTPAAKMIYELNIKHGTTKVSAQIVYYTYRHWNGWETRRLSRPRFVKDFNKFFTPHRTADGMCYLLNPKPFDLSEQACWYMQKLQREERYKKNKAN